MVYEMVTESDRISRLEGIVEAILDRLNSIDSRIGALESRMDGRFTALESRLDTRLTALESRIDTRFNWMFGLLVTTWITTMIAIIAILIRI